MKLEKIIFTLLFLGCCFSKSYSFNRLPSDYVIMKDGTRYEGLIVKNTADEIILQEPLGERIINKAYVDRINDADKSMVCFADFVNPNKAPSWRMMVQDLRCNDAIKSFVQIPAARITQGYLKNVPYLSFHVNKHAEMNVYGNPRDPACVELGAYLKGEQLKKFQEVARGFFAGYISSRKALATFYSLNLNGDEKRSGKFIFKIMPPTEPDSQGGWWISIYDPVALEKARVSDEVYQKLTLPANEVRKQDGTLRHDLEIRHHTFLATSMMRLFGKLPGFHGFYRDDENQLKIIFFPSSINQNK